MKLTVGSGIKKKASGGVKETKEAFRNFWGGGTRRRWGEKVELREQTIVKKRGGVKDPKKMSEVIKGEKLEIKRHRQVRRAGPRGEPACKL